MNALISENAQSDHSIFIDYFKVLRRRKWLILSCFGIVVILIGLWTLLSTPIYEAEATIFYDEPKDTMFALDIGQPFYNKSATINMTEVLQSRTLALEVAKSLPNSVIRTLKLPEILPQGLSQDAFIAGIIRENLFVNSVRGSDILKIYIQANDPGAAQIITNTYVSRIIDWSLRKKRMEISGVRNFVEEQLAVFHEKLNGAEDALRSFKEKNKIISLSDESTELLTRMTEAEASYNEVKAEREALERRFEYIERKRKELAPTLSVTTSPVAQQIKKKLFELESLYSTYQLQGHTDTQPEMLSLKQTIQQMKQDLVQELLRTTHQEQLIDPLSQLRNLLHESITLEVDLETFKAREQGYNQVLNEYEKKLQTLPGQELELARLIRAREVNDKIYSMLLEKLEEARITEASKIGDVHIIDTAEKPNKPIKPQKRKNLALAFILGLSLGVGLAFFLESLDTSLKSQEDVEKYVKLPVMAAIPTINQNGSYKFNKNSISNKNYYHKLFSQLNTHTASYEAYRSLQLNFAFINADRKLKSILVTSSGAAEGKTLTSINIAQLFSKSGVGTLLMDCDLRRPMVHKVLEMKINPGLTDILIMKVEIDQGIQKMENNLAVIPCGTLPPNPYELLSSMKMKELLTELRNKYQMIIIDAPPLLPVTDALVLSNLVDGICLVIRSGNTKRDIALKAKKILESSNTKIIGTILNDIDLKNVYGYYSNYYYYANNGTRKRKRK